MSEQKDVVSTEHPLFIDSQKARTTWRDVIAGTERMREKGKTYLPKFPQESDASYEVRRSQATLQNITGKTLESFVGLVFQQDITLGDDVSSEFESLSENIDNKGNHLNVFAREIFEASFDGWAAILVDSPTARATDLGEQKSLGLRPYWVGYHADDVINWDYEINPTSKRRELSLIVFREVISRKKGVFIRENVTQYRVFLKNGMRVEWQLWEEQEAQKGSKDKTYVQIGFGVIANQSQIPVAVIGELGDRPPLMDLCYKNIEHYQDYSDYRSLKHKTAVPLFYTVNLDGEPNAVGGDIWFKCNEGGSIGWAVTDSKALDSHVHGLETVKKEMAQLGLAMLAGQATQGDVTATETMLDSIQETSALQVRATQLKDALELAMGFTAQYMGKGEDQGGSIELGANWNQMVLSAQEIQTLNTLVSDGNLSLESFLWHLEKAGKLPPDVTAEEEVKRIEEETKALKPLQNAQQMPGGPNDETNPQFTQAGQTQGANEGRGVSESV